MQQGLLGGDSAYLLLVVGALFVHACYQLSVSVLTYMSSHKLSQKASVRQLLRLGFSYAGGVILTTALLLVAVASLLSSIKSDTPRIAVAIVIACASFIGLLTMTIYYRRGKGTQLWLSFETSEKNSSWRRVCHARSRNRSRRTAFPFRTTPHSRHCRCKPAAIRMARMGRRLWLSRKPSSHRYNALPHQWS